MMNMKKKAQSLTDILCKTYLLLLQSAQPQCVSGASQEDLSALLFLHNRFCLLVCWGFNALAAAATCLHSIYRAVRHNHSTARWWRPWCRSDRNHSWKTVLQLRLRCHAPFHLCHRELSTPPVWFHLKSVLVNWTSSALNVDLVLWDMSTVCCLFF